MEKRPLTMRQQKALDYIRSHVEEHGYPPNMRDLGKAVGLTSSSSVAHVLDGLESRGWIRREHRVARGIKIL
jgi:repressor LexA